MVTEPMPPLPRLLTADEVSEQTGIPLWRVYALTRSGAIPHVRIGRACRYSAEQLAAWLASGGTGPYRNAATRASTSDSA
jgi:excisionase family DNA binding protein